MGNRLETLSIIESLLGMDFNRSEDWINGNYGNFVGFLDKAMWITGKTVCIDDPDHKDVVVPTASIAQYILENHSTNIIFYSEYHI